MSVVILSVPPPPESPRVCYMSVVILAVPRPTPYFFIQIEIRNLKSITKKQKQKTLVKKLKLKLRFNNK